jgi:uncharacterized cofD-like protein
MDPQTPLSLTAGTAPAAPPLDIRCTLAPTRRIVAIGGGTGLPVVLSGLADRLRRRHSAAGPDSELTAIVTVTDDGGSSGWVRRELGMLPPGDVRNCLAALAGRRSPLARVLQHRFTDANLLSGQSVGNLMIAALTQMTGDFAEAVDQLASMLGTRGRVLPSTQEHVMLRAVFESGAAATGESAIVERGERIVRLSLDRGARPMPDAVRAIVNADAIVVGPGSLYTSVLPNLLVGGLAATISGVNAVRIYVANLMTEPGETSGYTLDAHLRAIREHVGLDLFDVVLVNRLPLSAAVLAQQRARGAEPVLPESFLPSAANARVVRRDLAMELPGGEVRHSADALAAAILDIVRRCRGRD